MRISVNETNIVSLKSKESQELTICENNGGFDISIGNRSYHAYDGEISLLANANRYERQIEIVDGATYRVKHDMDNNLPYLLAHGHVFHNAPNGVEIEFVDVNSRDSFAVKVGSRFPAITGYINIVVDKRTL